MKIKLAVVREYLKNNGWSHDPATDLQPNKFQDFYKEDDTTGETFGLFLPVRKLRDFNRRMVDLLLDLASVENRTEHEILREMTGCEWLEAIRFFKKHGYRD